jgi:antitoxin component YwqK of YwqJK toxin-antitoxin module
MTSAAVLVLGCTLFTGCGSLCSNFGWGCPEVNFDDLVERQGLLYKKFSSDPISGKAIGKKTGLLRKSKREGIWRSYREDGSLREETSYQGGVEHGLKTYWYENGNKEEEGTYKDGEKHGLFTNWYENGNKLRERTYKDGEDHGPYTLWYENGNKRVEGTYKNDNTQGLWTYYDQDGSIARRRTYENGIEVPLTQSPQ